MHSFQEHLVDEGASPITLNATISSLKIFFDVAFTIGVTPHSGTDSRIAGSSLPISVVVSVTACSYGS